MMGKDFKWIMVDDQEGLYTSNIYYHKWYGWIAIKSISGPFDFVVEKSTEIVDMLNTVY